MVIDILCKYISTKYEFIIYSCLANYVNKMDKDATMLWLILQDVLNSYKIVENRI